MSAETSKIPISKHSNGHLEAKPRQTWGWRQDEQALAVGLTLSLALTGIVSAVSHRLTEVAHPPDGGAMWYYWVLPEPTTTTRLTAWSLYLCHQVLHWAMLYYGQNYVNYSHSLQPFHYWMAGMNFLFIGLHLLSTHTTYDGLAQDTHIVSALGAVAIMLIWVLLMENNRRGLFFGYSIPFPKDLIQFSRKYHGYYFSWAIVYNFWYHPMEGTFPHLSGLLYKFILMTQSCLFMTPIHYNKYWTCALEFIVLVHGTSVSFFMYPETLAMFFFGFGLIFVISQMHGIGLSHTTKVAIALLMLVGCTVYYWLTGIYKIGEVFRIAVTDYVGVFVLAVILWCVKMTCQCCAKN